MNIDLTECIKSGVEQAMKECELTIGMTLKEAVEKQIPKKLIKWADGTEHCPTCDCDNSCIGYGVCIDCGQKLDWSK